MLSLHDLCVYVWEKITIMNRILCLFDYITIAENAVNDCFYGYLRAKTVQSKKVYATVKRKKDFGIGV